MSWISSASSDRKPTEGGFTLVELLISISIMVIVASIILTRQTAFNSAVLLRGQAYEIALQVREVQLSAVSASGVSGNFRSVLGVHFDTNNLSDDHFHQFRDADDDNFYDPVEEFGLQGRLDPRFEIAELRVIGDTITGTEVSAIFVRPNFDARFFDSSGELAASSLEIDVRRRGSTGTGPGDVRTIEITSTGQISVQ
jgi:prepilin-type N-terminal cleavage/methylation domain